MIPRIRLQRLVPQDREAWQKKYYGHQKHWQRRRLEEHGGTVLYRFTLKNNEI